MVRLCLLEYRVEDLEWLKAQARAVLRDGAHVPEGRSLARTAEFFAGRAVLASLFRAIGWEGYVDPNPFFGYLTAAPKPGQRGEAPHISLTHTARDGNGIAVAAATDVPLGVDAESETRDARRALERVALAEELFGLEAAVVTAAGGQRVPGPVALWSAKEAVSKATGLGIKFGMTCFVVALRGEPPYSVRIDREGPLRVERPAVRFHRHAGYVLSICTERGRLAADPDLARIAAPSKGKAS